MRLIDVHRRIEVLEKDKDIEVAVNQYVSVQPTAYDVDKVIEDLEYERKDVPDDKDYWSWVSAIDKAIEIVKLGGVSDDVCEWRKHSICGFYSEHVGAVRIINMADGYILWKEDKDCR